MRAIALSFVAGWSEVFSTSAETLIALSGFPKIVAKNSHELLREPHRFSQPLDQLTTFFGERPGPFLALPKSLFGHGSFHDVGGVSRQQIQVVKRLVGESLR